MTGASWKTVAIACLAYCLAGCSNTSVQVFDHRVVDGRKDPRSARPLVCATSAACRSMNPNGAAGWCEATALVHSSLLRIGPLGGVQGDLAAAWAFEADGALSLTLRSNARWHDGRTVTTEDVRATLANVGPLPESIQVEIINGLQCRLTHRASQAEVVDRIAQLAVLPAHLPMDGTQAVGAGPFRYVEAAGDASIFAAHDAWHGGKVQLRSVILHAMPSPKVRAQALAAGQIDAAVIGPSELPLLADVRAFRKHPVVTGGDPPEGGERTLVVSTYVQPLTQNSVSSDWAWVRRLASADYEGR